MNIMNHWFLGATHVEYSQLFLWKLYRMMGMGQHLFYIILQGDIFIRTCSLCFLQGFNLGTSHSPSFGLVWSKHDSTKLHSQMHPARDLKHVQTNSNCSMLAIKSKGTGHHFSNKITRICSECVDPGEHVAEILRCSKLAGTGNS